MIKRLIALASMVLTLNILQARYDHSDTQTSMTVEQANKNAKEAENKKQNIIWLSVGATTILAVLVIMRRRKRTVIHS